MNSQRLSWHGLRLTLPADWSPVKIEGGWDRGSIQIADLHRPRLAIRWQSVRRPAAFDVDRWARDAIRGEVGELMAGRSVALPASDAWSAGRLFLEPEPPGRDIWVAQHRASERLVEVVCPVRSRDRALVEQILPTLRACPRDAARHFSIFDLACTVPPGWTLSSHRLNAGDLSLTFASGRQTLTVRQVGPATLALTRQSLDRWLAMHARAWRKFYRPEVPAGSAAAAEPDRMTLTRRRRFFYMRQLPPRRWIIGRHDVDRDRLVFLDAGDRTVAELVLASVGQIGDDADSPCSAAPPTSPAS